MGRNELLDPAAPAPDHVWWSPSLNAILEEANDPGYTFWSVDQQQWMFLFALPDDAVEFRPVKPAPTFGDKLIEFLGEPELPFLVRVAAGKAARAVAVRWRAEGAPMDLPTLRASFPDRVDPDTATHGGES